MSSTREYLRRAWDAVIASPFADNPLLLAVAGIGFSVSFQTIAHLAAAHHLPGPGVLYPIGIDVMILALILEARKLVTLGRSDIVPRVMAWVLTGFTIYVNVHGSPASDLLGRALHAVMPALWVVFLELTRQRQKADVDTDRSLEAMPLARWFADLPWRTAGMKRRQVLNGVRNYRVMCAREEARILARSLAKDVWGRRWRRKAPVLLREHLRLGTFPAEVADAAAAATRGVMPSMAEPVEKWVAGLVKQQAGAASRVKQQRRAVETSPPAAALPADMSTASSADMSATRQPVTPPEVSGRAEAARLLMEKPGMKLEDVAAAAGVSLSTVNRVKREMPTPLHIAKEA